MASLNIFKWEIKVGSGYQYMRASSVIWFKCQLATTFWPFKFLQWARQNDFRKPQNTKSHWSVVGRCCGSRLFKIGLKIIFVFAMIKDKPFVSQRLKLKREKKNTEQVVWRINKKIWYYKRCGGHLHLPVSTDGRSICPSLIDSCFHCWADKWR